MKIYTRTGDLGTSGLFGGDRVSKDDVRLHAYGTLDELNATIGSILAMGEVPKNIHEQLLRVQNLLFEMGADLATPLTNTGTIKRLTTESAEEMEGWIDALEENLPPLTSFILPGGSASGAKLHEARTICRRAERWMVTLKDAEPINKNLLVIVNRLSDYLFVAARAVNHTLGVPEQAVEIPRAATRAPSPDAETKS
ncbi:MAG: cob(I)yrinic acid a,c-diamide adenosyltransferase [Candidatus Peribacteraceae bacterium]